MESEFAIPPLNKDQLSEKEKEGYIKDRLQKAQKQSQSELLTPGPRYMKQLIEGIKKS